MADRKYWTLYAEGPRRPRHFAAGVYATRVRTADGVHDAVRTDGALVLHVFEELFQHLGHMEVTADAVAPTSS